MLVLEGLELLRYKEKAVRLARNRLGEKVIWIPDSRLKYGTG